MPLPTPAGGFVKDAYLLPLEANQGQLLVTALWSRSEERVSALLPDFQRRAPCCSCGRALFCVVPGSPSGRWHVL